MIHENIKNILENLALPYKEIEHIASTSCDHSKELREKQ